MDGRRAPLPVGELAHKGRIDDSSCSQLPSSATRAGISVRAFGAVPRLGQAQPLAPQRTDGAPPWRAAVPHPCIEDEAIRAGRIEHALAMSFSYPGPCFVPPASIGGGLYTGPDAMPMGARLQLDPNLDLNTLGLSPAARIIARALQEYGMIVVDQGASNPGLYAESFYGKPNNPWAGVLTERDLLNIPTNRFRVLKLGPQNCTPY